MIARQAHVEALACDTENNPVAGTFQGGVIKNACPVAKPSSGTDIPVYVITNSIDGSQNDNLHHNVETEKTHLRHRQINLPLSICAQ